MTFLFLFYIFIKDKPIDPSINYRQVFAELDEKKILNNEDVLLSDNWALIYARKNAEQVRKMVSIFHYHLFKNDFSSFEEFLRKMNVTIYCFEPNQKYSIPILNGFKNEIDQVLSENKDLFHEYTLGANVDSFTCVRFHDKY